MSHESGVSDAFVVSLDSCLVRLTRLVCLDSLLISLCLVRSKSNISCENGDRIIYSYT